MVAVVIFCALYSALLCESPDTLIICVHQLPGVVQWMAGSSNCLHKSAEALLIVTHLLTDRYCYASTIERNQQLGKRTHASFGAIVSRWILRSQIEVNGHNFYHS